MIAMVILHEMIENLQWRPSHQDLNSAGSRQQQQRQIYDLNPLFSHNSNINHLRIYPSILRFPSFVEWGRVRVSDFLPDLGVCWLEGHPGLVCGFSKRNTELEKLGDDGGEVLEEEGFVGSVFLDVLLEGLIGDESHVGWKHHQGFGGLIFVLLRSLAHLMVCWKM